MAGKLARAKRAATTVPVAVDAMGGDHAPEEVVAGAVTVVREHGIPVVLVGRESEILPLLAEAGHGLDGLEVVDAPDVVAMEEHAVAAIRKKVRASIVVACEQVRDGYAGAVVSAGNSGAVVAAAIFILGRQPNVERPGIAVPFPRHSGGLVYLIDAGAVVDPRPAHLVRYAFLIRDYLRDVQGVPHPRIGLLSNGTEPGKGDALARDVYEELSGAADLNFIGNIEANLISTGSVDAVVTDGFTGNVTLKTAEGAADFVARTLRRELSSRWYTKLLAAGLRPAFRRVGAAIDYREYGGAQLLGVAKPVIIAHGRSDRHATVNAILSAEKAARQTGTQTESTRERA